MITIQHMLDALNVGGLYALIALGIGLIFGIMRLINFAHGELVMAGGYAMAVLVSLPWPAVIILSLLFLIGLALLIERAAFRPLRGRDPATLLVASFTVSYFLQNLTILWFGSRPIPFTFAQGMSEIVEIAGLRFPLLQFIRSIGIPFSPSGWPCFKKSALGIQLRGSRGSRDRPAVGHPSQSGDRSLSR